MEIKIKGKYTGNKQNIKEVIRYQIETEQERGRGSEFQLVKIREQDIEDFEQLAGQKVSLFCVCRKTAPADNRIFSLVREQEPNTAENE